MDNWDSYNKIFEDIKRRNNLDWDNMDKADRYVIKTTLLQVINDLQMQIQGIEAWENIYGKVENGIVLQ